MIIWIIGLSGSGKSTLAEAFVKWASSDHYTFVKLDGDDVRELYDHTLGHSFDDRRMNAKRIINLCRFLDRQCIHVVAPILSISQEDRDRCRSLFRSYFEIFIDCDLETLEMRDTKGLYSQYKAGKLSDVVGKDIVLDPPVKSDFIIQNRYSVEEFLTRGRGIFDEIMTHGL